MHSSDADQIPVNSTLPNTVPVKCTHPDTKIGSLLLVLLAARLCFRVGVVLTLESWGDLRWKSRSGPQNDSAATIHASSIRGIHSTHANIRYIVRLELPPSAPTAILACSVWLPLFSSVMQSFRSNAAMIQGAYWDCCPIGSHEGIPWFLHVFRFTLGLPCK